MSELGEVSVKDLGEGSAMTVDEFVRILIGQLFDNDNDTTTLKTAMKADDGTVSNIEFTIVINNIDGVSPREERDNG